jgi:hypothetical protein
MKHKIKKPKTRKAAAARPRHIADALREAGDALMTRPQSDFDYDSIADYLMERAAFLSSVVERLKISLKQNSSSGEFADRIKVLIDQLARNIAIISDEAIFARAFKNARAAEPGLFARN